MLAAYRGLRQVAATLLAVLSVSAEQCFIGALVLDQESYERTLQNLLALKVLVSIRPHLPTVHL